MLYVPFCWIKKNHSKGTSKVLNGGGSQRSMVKDYISTFFFGPVPNHLKNMRITHDFAQCSK